MTKDKDDIIEEIEEITEERISRDDLANLILDTVDIKFEMKGKIKTFAVRPITWKEEMEIDQAVKAMKFPTITDERDLRTARARERMRLIVQQALDEPKLSKEEIFNLPAGLVLALATEIDRISSYQAKNA